MGNWRFRPWTWLRAKAAPHADPPAHGLHRILVDALVRAAADGDAVVAAHLERVERLCRGVGRLLELIPDKLEALGIAARLHEIDRIALPPALDADRALGVHPALGAQLIAALALPWPVHTIVRHRQERWDGTGKPDGLRGRAIPLGARILAAADAYDGARDPHEGETQLRVQSGRAFDPEIVDALLHVLDARRGRRLPPERPSSAFPLAAGRDELQLLERAACAAALPLPFDEQLTL
ncbi:MAG TPA: HD domain-containing phosphohydrolase, partial [Candidatus Polarisedimenticolaceae bacterium]|nr:HD domain-containing phosphohydrolase [Candidatus Polarisedimenticolaceae bacterium]